ncbi:DnaJ domain-containing protein [Trichocoleus desertorum AS-A10]|uniref:J domain-containing protein n=1 Tax=Trichocoleus desertorum TaxID=1481672 RepID=UPI0032971C5E
MSFQIDRGLFKLDFTDYYAILGVPINSDAKEIRKRYLKIARNLHPDSFSSESEDEKQQATELLSKLVNPAYEKLSQDRERAEYEVLVRLKGQQAIKEKDSVQIFSEVATQLSKANDVDHAYKTALQEIATKQYQTLDQILELTGQISELNFVYLLRKGGAVPGSSQTKNQATGAATSNQAGKSNQAANAAPAPSNASQAKPTAVEQYCRRAEELIVRNAFAQAILELRDGLKLEPNNSRCHGLLGMVYLKQNQAKMAKIHIERALQLNPKDEIALEAKQKLDKLSAGTGGKAKPAKAGQSEKPRDSGGGLFGLFGGKKK